MFINTFNFLVFIILYISNMRLIQSLKLFNPKTFRTAFAFCQSRDIAIISSKIISMIQDQQKEDTKCLGLKLSQLNIKDFPEKYQIKTQNLQNIKKMFTTGVQLPQYYLSQERITHALRAEEKNQPQSLFVFYPTWITTTHVFQYMRKKRRLCLFSGDRGVGKTVSFILYSILMNNITRYVFKNKQAAIELIQDKIIKSPEKVFYWSYQPQLLSGTIVNQISQMINDNVNPKEYKKYLLGLEEQNLNLLSFKIKNFYTANDNEGLVKTVIIIDQINALASLYRKHNAKINNMKFKTKQVQLQSQTKLQKLNQIMHDISSMATYRIYNSSVNIQESLLYKEYSRNQPELTMNINSHQGLARPQLNYQFRITQKKAICQTLYYIGMQYRKYFSKFNGSQIQEQMKKWKLKQTKLLDESIEIIKNHIQSDITCAFPLLFIRKYLENVDYQPTQIKTAIKQYYQNKLVQFQGFIKKMSIISQNEGPKMTQVLIFLSDQISSLTNQTNNITIDRQKLFQHMNRKFSDIVDEKIINDYMNKSIFPYSTQQKGYICTIPIKLIEPFLRQERNKSFLLNIQYFLAEFRINQQSRSTIGSLLEDWIITGVQYCIKKKGSFIIKGIINGIIVAQGKFYQLNSPKESKQKSQKQEIENAKQAKKIEINEELDKQAKEAKEAKEATKMKIDEELGTKGKKAKKHKKDIKNKIDQELDKKNKKTKKTREAKEATKIEIDEELYLQGNMIQMIKMAEANQRQFCFALPYHRNMPSQRSFNSQVADCCLIKYDPDYPQKYQFNFIDIKCGNQIPFSDINTNAEQFKKKFKVSLKFANISQNEYIVNVIIVCKKQQNKKYQKYQHIRVQDIKTVEFIVANQSTVITLANKLLKEI